MASKIGILLFDGAEEMDFVGPWEIFAAASDDGAGEPVLTVAERVEPIHCEKGLRVIPDCSYRDRPRLDVVLVPGGSGARREITNPATVGWLRAMAAGCSWLTSVCTGAFLLAGAGLARGWRVTTHHDLLAELRGLGGVTVVHGVRFVRDGNLVTAAGVMSGIEMCLWLVGELCGPDILQKTKSNIAYDHPPRDRAEH